MTALLKPFKASQIIYFDSHFNCYIRYRGPCIFFFSATICPPKFARTFFVETDLPFFPSRFLLTIEICLRESGFQTEDFLSGDMPKKAIRVIAKTPEFAPLRPLEHSLS